MKTISINVEVNEKQYAAMHKLAEIRGYESLEEELQDDIKSTARRAIENLRDEQEEVNERRSRNDIANKLIESVDALRLSIEKAR